MTEPNKPINQILNLQTLELVSDSQKINHLKTNKLTTDTLTVTNLNVTNLKINGSSLDLKTKMQFTIPVDKSYKAGDVVSLPINGATQTFLKHCSSASSIHNPLLCVFKNNIYVSYNSITENKKHTIEDFNNKSIEIKDSYSMFIAKMDEFGNQIFFKMAGNNNLSYIQDLSITDLGIFVTGNIFLNEFAKDFNGTIIKFANSDFGIYSFVARLDRNGNQIFFKICGNGMSNKISKIKCIGESIYLCGEFNNFFNTSPNSYDFNGNLVPRISENDIFICRLKVDSTQIFFKLAGSNFKTSINLMVVHAIGPKPNFPPSEDFKSKSKSKTKKILEFLSEAKHEYIYITGMTGENFIDFNHKKNNYLQCVSYLIKFDQAGNQIYTFVIDGICNTAIICQNNGVYFAGVDKDNSYIYHVNNDGKSIFDHSIKGITILKLDGYILNKKHYVVGVGKTLEEKIKILLMSDEKIIFSRDADNKLYNNCINVKLINNYIYLSFIVDSEYGFKTFDDQFIDIGTEHGINWVICKFDTTGKQLYCKVSGSNFDITDTHCLEMNDLNTRLYSLSVINNEFLCNKGAHEIILDNFYFKDFNGGHLFNDSKSTLIIVGIEALRRPIGLAAKDSHIDEKGIERVLVIMMGDAGLQKLNANTNYYWDNNVTISDKESSYLIGTTTDDGNLIINIRSS